MPTIKSVIGTSTEQEFKLDGTNSIDVFPTLSYVPQGVGSPDAGTITIQGVTYPTALWANGEYIGVSFELNHQYKSGGNCEMHTRFFPVNDNAGTVVFTYEYYVLHVDGTTSAGDTLTLSGAITAGDKTANIGQYISAAITGTNLTEGDQLVGVFTRDASGTYASDVSLTEIGVHIPVGQTGTDF